MGKQGKSIENLKTKNHIKQLRDHFSDNQTIHADFFKWL